MGRGYKHLENDTIQSISGKSRNASGTGEVKNLNWRRRSPKILWSFVISRTRVVNRTKFGRAFKKDLKPP